MKCYKEKPYGIGFACLSHISGRLHLSYCINRLIACCHGW